MVVFIVMGVCGSGKTTIAEALASKLECSFRDADEFHSDENKQKMSSGLPLSDEDRLPWLLAIHEHIRRLLEHKNTGVVTCSSLKRWYRHILVTGDTNMQPDNSHVQNDVLFVYLKGSIEVLKHRLRFRVGHFMPPTLLQSQLDTMEEPNETENHVTCNIEHSIEDIVSDIIKYISV